MAVLYGLGDIASGAASGAVWEDGSVRSVSVEKFDAILSSSERLVVLLSVKAG